ncbi:carbohydrate ABC transporter permease, partial [Streptomyces sp. SID7982]|nr:carbohydrate ABC transporter permease [Streptomyces sp. SID7982]
MSATSSAPVKHLDKGPRGKRSVTRPLTYVLLSLGLLVMSAPFLWMGISAFKTQSELSASPPVWIPTEWTLTNFRQLLDKLD